MRPMLSLLRREFTAYFLNPAGYAALFGFLVLSGLAFNLNLSLLTEQGPEGVEYPMQVMFGGADAPAMAQVAGVLFWGLFPAITGMLTMRLLAEERGSGTLETLLTAPIRDWQIVTAKFLGCYAFYLVLWLPTLIYVPILADLQVEFHEIFTPSSLALLAGSGLAVVAVLSSCCLRARWVLLGLGVGVLVAAVGGWFHYRADPPHLLHLAAGIDPAPLLTSAVGITLAGGMFLAIGMFVSSLVRSQLVAWMIALLAGLAFVVPALLRFVVESGSPADAWVYYLSVPEHFRRTFTRGQLDTRPLVLYASVMLLGLYLTTRSLEAQRR